MIQQIFLKFTHSYYNGIRSSRKIEQECNRNIELMWLTGKLTPDFLVRRLCFYTV